MRALLLREATGPDGLELTDVDPPAVTDGMVLIDVHAAGVGFVDMLITKGEYQIKPPLPFVPGLEVAGTVAAGGPLPVGTRVCATTPFGGFAEQALAPASVVFPIPDELAFDAAAGCVINYQTAHLALTRRGRLAPGEVVLVHGAGGGVGTATIEVARALDAGLVIGVAHGEEKLAAARAAGAGEVVDAEGDWVAQVRALTDGRGADVVVDPVGGDRFDQSLRCMAPEGRLLVVGFASGRIPELPVNRLLLRHLDVVGVNYGGMLGVDGDFAARAADELFGWVRDGRIAPQVGARYALADGGDAMRDLAERRVAGKPVLIVRGGA
jgi:NADPH2:quinone reductase